MGSPGQRARSISTVTVEPSITWFVPIRQPPSSLSSDLPCRVDLPLVVDVP